MSYVSNGICTPPKATLKLSAAVFAYEGTAQILQIAKYAGSQIGSATIAYRANYADGVPPVGAEMVLSLNGTVVWRGVIMEAPATISEDEDQVLLVGACDKELLDREIVGAVGIGSQAGGGFRHVGYDITFNPGGAPNRQATGRDFDKGSSAAYWTLEQILRWVFDYYVQATSVTLTGFLPSFGWSQVLPDISLAGQSALQAIDYLCGLAGESWGLRYRTGGSEFVSIRPGTGDDAYVSVFQPKNRASASNVTDQHGYVSVRRSLRLSRSTHCAISGRMVIETTYQSGTSELLTRSTTFKDPDAKYTQHYLVDVTAYAAHGLGQSLTAGARPKPWRDALVSRLNGSSYMTAAEIDAVAARKTTAPQARPVIWIKLTDSHDVWFMCHGGSKIDTEHCRLSFQDEVTLMLTDDLVSAAEDLEGWNLDHFVTVDQAEKKANVVVADWALVTVRLTIATEIEERETADVFGGGTVWGRVLIQRDDLIPEARINSTLPDLTDMAASVDVASGTREMYVSQQDALQTACELSVRSSPGVETEIRARMPFVPIFEIGARLRVQGRSLGTTGNEAIKEISYEFVDGVPTMANVIGSDTTAGMGGA